MASVCIARSGSTGQRTRANHQNIAKDIDTDIVTYAPSTQSHRHGDTFISGQSMEERDAPVLVRIAGVEHVASVAHQACGLNVGAKA